MGFLIVAKPGSVTPPIGNAAADGGLYGGGGNPAGPRYGSSPGVMGGMGGQGAVIVCYTGSSALFTGGTIVISGGKVTHTFTSSGTLTKT